MVCEWGMSSIGLITLERKNDMIFLGRDIISHTEYSEETAKKIDMEVKKIIDNCYQRGKNVILENKDKLKKIATLLLERESLSSEDINDVLNNKKLKPLTKKAPSKTMSNKKNFKTNKPPANK